MSLLAGLRVVDLSTEIAGPYATKLLADAGADVIKVEPAGGDPLRSWSASRADLGDRDGALFQFLNASKRSLVGVADDTHVATLVADADVVVEDGHVSETLLAEWRATYSRLTVVSVTSFGRTGPWADRPATEFTLQAACGSTTTRGVLDREPLHAGGRLGEWISGTYAAAGALAAVFGGGGEHIDVSMLECMSVTVGGYNALHMSLAGALESAADFPGPFRSVEVPSVEPTSDDLVGLTTITGQQFEDLLSLIGHPELRGDPRFATAMRRTRNVVEFSAMLHEWTRARTTDEVIEQASLLRIPVTPVGTPSTVATFDHFVSRGVYAEGPGGFVRPRPPYHVSDVPHRSPAASPSLDEHAGATWSSEARTSAPRRSVGRPLDGVRIVDFTAFWAGPSSTNLLAALGADVIKIESAGRPDGIRFSSSKPPTEDRWWEWSAVFQANNANKRGITLDLSGDRGRELVLDLIATADVVVENFSPRVLDAFGITWEAVHARNPRAVMARMPAFGLDGPWRERTGFAQTMEQVSGMAWLSGFVDGPPVIPRGACDPLAGMHAATAILATLLERDVSGEGRFIEVTMVEAALNVAAEVVIEHSAYGASLHRAGNRGPVAAPQGVYACAGTERWLAIAVRTDAQWSALVDVLGAPDGVQASPSAAQRRDAHDAIDAHLSGACASRDAASLADELVAVGVPAAVVDTPPAVLANPQLQARGFVETLDGPVIGQHPCLGVPFRFASRPGPWFESPAPTLGQHTREVLTTVLGLADADVDVLAETGVIGDRPGG